MTLYDEKNRQNVRFSYFIFALFFIWMIVIFVLALMAGPN
jgi:hypothetical protein